jgi:hypothetical protein
LAIRATGALVDEILNPLPGVRREAKVTALGDQVEAKCHLMAADGQF